MEYYIDGVPAYRRGKRRPNTPKTVTCHKCGREAKKIGYGTYACKDCYLCYQFYFGKLIRGSYTYQNKMVTYKNGLIAEKGEWVCSFLSQDGKFIDYPFKKI